MKLKTVLLLLVLLTATATAEVPDWKGKFGAGGRIPVFMPMLAGSEFELFGNESEPFGMGWDVGIHGRYGLTERLVLNLSIAYASSYDDSTSTGGQSFSFNNSDNAFARLEGLLFGLTANYYFRYEEKTQPYVIGGIGVDSWRINRRSVPQGTNPYTPTINDINLKIGAGVNYWLSEKFTLDFQALFTYGLFKISNNWPEGEYGDGDWSSWKERPFKAYMEPSFGLTYYLWGTPDTDKDGVNDKKDQCPETPLGAIVDLVGCPIDSDGDGVYDGFDMCPDTPKGAKVDTKGCPLDTDKDGIFDGIDQCPNTPEGVTVNDIGCPFDKDKDGVYDYKDKCPDTPAGVKVDADGCPIDTDKDGVPDYKDKCPNTHVGIEVDSMGCPFAAILKETVTLRGGLNYSSGSFTISEEAVPALDEIAESMIKYDFVKIDIRGYCDSDGAETFNQTLSENRAKAIYDYLIGKGIAADRMNVKGFGEDPKFFIAPNDTQENKLKNRRVEIEMVK